MHIEKLVVSYIVKPCVYYYNIYNLLIIIIYYILESKFTVSTNGDEEEVRRFESNKNHVIDTNSDEVNTKLYTDNHLMYLRILLKISFLYHYIIQKPINRGCKYYIYQIGYL